MKLLSGLVGVVLVAAFVPAASAVVVGFEDFDGGAINLNGTVNVFDYGAGGGTGGDMFGRMVPGVTGSAFDLADDSAAGVSGTSGLPGTPFPTDTRGVVGQNSSAVFGIVDADGNVDGSGNGLNDAVWSFDISGGLAISSIAIDIGAIGDWELSTDDGIRIDARIDGNAFQTIFLARPDESIDPYTYRPMDGGYVPMENDPLELFVDGALTSVGILDKSVPATGALDTYVSTLLAGGIGTTLDVRVSWDGTPSGSEAIALDNITVNAIPEPATLALLGLGALALVYRRRK